VQHEVVLLHERVAHLRVAQRDTRSASGTRRESR
jgi:hypothetical protein